MPRISHFHGGVHPRDEKKWTGHKTIENPPLPPQVVIPIQQHIGAPPVVLVNKGDTVLKGQPLAKADAFVSAPVHASLSGKVIAVENRPHPLGIESLSIVIENDGRDSSIEGLAFDPAFMDLSIDEMKKRITEAGLAGMGGAGFPTHVKLSPPKEKPMDLFILNGVECEPYLTSDHRLMLEKTDEIVHGLQIIMKILGVGNAVIAIEKNKSDAISVMREKISGNKAIRVLPLAVKYPQGAEKQLIRAATGRVVPSGGLPMDVGCLVHNVGTALALYEAVSSRKPLFERVVTVTGPGVRQPKNVRARIGTSFRTLIDFCGGYTEHAKKVINGGPMMGISEVTDEVPVIKGTSGILVLDEKTSRLEEERPCIACARCVDICPMRLLPSHLAAFVENGRIEKAQKFGLLDCIECGSCGYICPAKRNLVQYIKLGKSLWNAGSRKN